VNPLLPKPYFIPDVEARVMPDGRIYLYGSFDISGETFYCSPKLHVFSSENLRDWIDHGISFTKAEAHSPTLTRLFAPDCIEKDGQYYLYYCGDDWCEGVARSDQPNGPFTDAKPITGADRDGIDPALLKDDDGQVYYYWGQFSLRAARMNPDLSSLDPETFRSNLLNEREHGFHEGASVRKREGKYYLIYTDIGVTGKATCLSYAISDHPLGPFHRIGPIIDNSGCDPGTWNNHGSIEQFRGNWYVFYHRSYHGNRHNRRVCVEPIFFDDEGYIDPVIMTTQGVEGPLDPTRKMEAFRAAEISKSLRTRVIYPTSTDSEWVEFLADLKNGEYAIFRFFDFSEKVQSFQCTVGSATGGGSIEVRLDHLRGPLIANVEIPDTGGWYQWSEATAPLEAFYNGIHEVYLVFKGGMGNLGHLLDFRFLP
jgi:hypothetical protein